MRARGILLLLVVTLLASCSGGGPTAPATRQPPTAGIASSTPAAAATSAGPKPAVAATSAGSPTLDLCPATSLRTAATARGFAVGMGGLNQSSLYMVRDAGARETLLAQRLEMGPERRQPQPEPLVDEPA